MRTRVWQQPDWFTLWKMSPDYMPSPEPDLWRRSQIVSEIIRFYSDDREYFLENEWEHDLLYLLNFDYPFDFIYSFIEWLDSTLLKVWKWFYLYKSVICVWFNLQISQGKLIAPVGVCDVESVYWGDSPPGATQWKEISITAGLFTFNWSIDQEQSF